MSLNENLLDLQKFKFIAIYKGSSKNVIIVIKNKIKSKQKEKFEFGWIYNLLISSSSSNSSSSKESYITPLCERILYFSKCKAFFLFILWKENSSWRDSLLVCCLSTTGFISFSVVISLFSFSFLFSLPSFCVPIYTIVFVFPASWFDLGVWTISIFFKFINLSDVNSFFFGKFFFWSLFGSSWSSGRNMILCLILFFIDLKFDIKFKNFILSSSWIFLFKLSLLVSALFNEYLFFILFIPLKFVSAFWTSNFLSVLSLVIWCFRNKLDFFDFGENILCILFDAKNLFLSSVFIRFILGFLTDESLWRILFLFICLILLVILFTKFLIDENLLFLFSFDSLLYKIKSSFLKFIKLLFWLWVWVFFINEFIFNPGLLFELE